MSDPKEPVVLTPDLRAQLAPEFKAIEDAFFAKGQASGATAERERIQAVEAQLMPGHEKLIADLKFDGKTTGSEAAVKVLQAEKAKNAAKLTEIRKDAPAAVEAVATEEEIAKAKLPKTPQEQAALGVKMAAEAKTYHGQQHAGGNPITMTEATQFVYVRAGIPMR